MTDTFKAEKTKAGLKIFIPVNNDWLHIKTVKSKYESIIKDLSWVQTMKTITPSKGEKFTLETQFVISKTKFENKAIRDFVTAHYVVGLKVIHKLRDVDQYAMILENKTEVLCSVALITMGRKIGIEIQEVNRV